MYRETNYSCAGYLASFSRSHVASPSSGCSEKWCKATVARAHPAFFFFAYPKLALNKNTNEIAMRLVGTNDWFQFSGLSRSGVRVCMPHSSLLIISPEGKGNCNSRGAVGMAEEQLLRAAKLKLRRSIKILLYKARVVRCVHWQTAAVAGGRVTTEVFLFLSAPAVCSLSLLLVVDRRSLHRILVAYTPI